MDLNLAAKEIQVLVKFQKMENDSNNIITWCDDVKIFLIYGTDFEYLQSKYNVGYILEKFDECKSSPIYMDMLLRLEDYFYCSILLKI